MRGADVEVAGIAGADHPSYPLGDAERPGLSAARPRPAPRVRCVRAPVTLHVRVQVWTPSEDLTADEKRVIDELAKVHSAVPLGRHKGFWAKMKEALGA